MKLIKEIVIDILCFPAVFSVLFISGKLYFSIFPQCLYHADTEHTILEGLARICLGLIMTVAIFGIVGGLSALFDYCEAKIRKRKHMACVVV